MKNCEDLGSGIGPQGLSLGSVTYRLCDLGQVDFTAVGLNFKICEDQL